ncbi:hypothetical protein KHQ89_02455 [Mycoplasmatota bacterium]|nr:hypothetical protein KHQ89_02455 [Mycoplasmatota bacterium]
MSKLNKIYLITVVQSFIGFGLFVLLMYTFSLVQYENFEGVQSMSMLGLLGVSFLFYFRSIKNDIKESLE